MDFKEHLKRQLGFLKRSCCSYDEGYLDEAIRIATVLRVLVHQTQRSTSLLKHLNSTTINMLSTTFEPTEHTLSFVGMGVMRLSGDESSYYPHLGNGPFNEFIPVSKWWNQVVIVLDRNSRITRKNIVLAAANKDGGAHVDQKLTKEYESLAKEGAVGIFDYGKLGKEKPIQNAHLVSLRQMGFEVLNSPALINLTR